MCIRDSCEAIMKDCPMVLRATPVVRASGQVIYGNKNWSPETVEAAPWNT